MGKLKKILIGIVIFIVGIIILAMMATKGIADVAENQLKAIREGDIIKAYSFTSKDFRSATTLEAFKKFVDAYPSLKNNKSVSFSSRETNNGLGTLVGTLKSVDNGTTPIEYKLVKENDEWKILNVKLNPSGAGIKQTEETTTFPKSTQIQAKIFDILVNEAADKDGYVDTNKSVIDKSSPKIFATVQISNAQENSQVTMELMYVPTGEKIGPIVHEITKTGNIVKASSFTRTNDSWPVGEYKVIATLSNGDKKEVNISVK